MASEPNNPPGYKVIALISGGKDSFLSILKCQEQGHQVVALANLYPPTRDDDLNSHMYQTAGHALIPFYEQVLGIPLYRREITGLATQLGKEYDASRLSPQDEIEDLTALLQDILTKHPEANAVCSGAILSTYQRTRIEDVCLRLNLKPLAYLWQMSFLKGLDEATSISKQSATLLDHFAEIGLDARIVKVASGGLDESFLWQSICDSKTRHRLKSVMKKFGGSVVGEGGEFETIVLSGPRSLFRGRIIVPDEAIIIRTGEGGEAWVDIGDISQVHVEFHQDLIPEVQPSRKVAAPDSGAQTNTPKAISNPPTWSPIHGIRKKGNILWINNLHDESYATSAQAQIQHIVSQLKRILEQENFTSESLIFTTIILRNMEDFDVINLAYGQLFKSPIPPARVTFAAGSQMPRDLDILMSCVGYRGNLNHKQGLHVQSMSHWAPANIGPYSQAVSIPLQEDSDTPRLVYIAGQIPLVPETMQPMEFLQQTTNSAFRKQADLALRHATRIGIEMGVKCWNHAIAYVCSDHLMDASERANIAHDIWKDLHQNISQESSDGEEEDGLDVWDLKYGGHGSYDMVQEAERHLPSAEAMRGRTLPDFIAAQVHQLPRGSTIEWQVDSITQSSVRGTIEPDQNTKLFMPSQINLSQPLDGTTAIVPCYKVWRSIEGSLQELSFCYRFPNK